MNQSEMILEFHIIKQMLSDYALSEQAKTRLKQLTPTLNEQECHRRIKQTTEAKQMIEHFGNPPVTAMPDIEAILDLAQKGAMLTPEQLTKIIRFLSSCRQMQRYLAKAEHLQTHMTTYGQSIAAAEDLSEELNRCIRNHLVDDGASPQLRDIRRKIEVTKQQIKIKLESILKTKRAYCSDYVPVTRNGHFVLPVRKEYKHQVSGTVIDQSGSGGTVFIEPSAVQKLQQQLVTIEIEEHQEVEKILYTLSGLVDAYQAELKQNIEVMIILDVAFAKAKLSLEMQAIPVPIVSEHRMSIRLARHPLLDKQQCVPLNFSIGEMSKQEPLRGIVITGPNTGGKTVALKTVGLLSMMVQSGLHVPVAQGSYFCMHNQILCDIGDGQSITQNLSTFSAHILNIMEILQKTSQDTLVLLDELGSGTDPTEGMGIAIAILEELQSKGCLFVATTHYSEVKEFAATAKGLTNAKMAFDKETLKPLYRLELGEAGESCALYIAKRLGFSDHFIQRAAHYAYANTTVVKTPPLDLLSERQQTKPEKTQVKPQIQRAPKEKKLPEKALRFQIGDSVIVYPKKQIGIVYKRSNEQAQIGVQIQKSKHLISYKRLQLQTPASELYPPDYDFSIIFDSVENRKARKKMSKHHDPNQVIYYDTK